MAGIEISGLEELDARLAQLVEEHPERQKAMHEELAEMLKQELGDAIGSSVTEHTGELRSWQESRVGSRGGYAAISPKRGKRGKDSFGKITNAVEDGHRARRPSGNAKRYRARIHTLRIDGRHFYTKARTSATGKALMIAQKYVDQIAEELEG